MCIKDIYEDFIPILEKSRIISLTSVNYMDYKRTRITDKCELHGL